MSETVVDEVVTYWRMIVTTLRRRGLLRERFPSGEVVVPEADAYVIPDRVVFVLHMQHLGGDGLALTISRDPVVGQRRSIGPQQSE